MIKMYRRVRGGTNTINLYEKTNQLIRLVGNKRDITKISLYVKKDRPFSGQKFVCEIKGIRMITNSIAPFCFWVRCKVRD
ncbi:hypothetical protein P4380_27150 [Bacillus thuringiensis]|nr:hypothetical protein [Bacillus thuringiensis]OTZ58100.1 hypothetical protein BK762_00890 [Bacillus thuringiensis serovar toumanoffi]MED3219992.1 hypothetical protein [Bacillus thuringiensis]PFF41053.1 hypothetical protein CN335_08285 [Bacillus thuringiensis]PFT09173.1 hypothetical protein COK83_25660 [Bacillus thuringiensis]PGK36563.1 hypothetical protein CN908_22225 [Bacillus thuringiensis]